MCNFIKMKKIFVTALCSASVLLGLALYAGQSVKPEMKALYDANVEALSAVERVSENVYDMGDGRVMYAGMLNRERDGQLLNACVAGDGVCVLSSTKDANNRVTVYEYLSCKFSEMCAVMAGNMFEVLLMMLQSTSVPAV